MPRGLEPTWLASRRRRHWEVAAPNSRPHEVLVRVADAVDALAMPGASWKSRASPRFTFLKLRSRDYLDMKGGRRAATYTISLCRLVHVVLSGPSVQA